MTKLTNSSL